MGSSKKPGSKILGTVTRAEADRLLLDLANVHDKPESLQRIRDRNPDTLGNVDDHILIQLQGVLRLAWTAQDARHRDWFIFQVRDVYCAFQLDQQMALSERPDDPYPREVILPSGGTLTTWGGESSSTKLERRRLQPPPPTIFEATMYYFQRSIAERAKFCPVPGCHAPYFVAAKRWQKYCSEACAGPANREAKRKWWHENKGKGLL